jgi:hypothetical protein
MSSSGQPRTTIDTLALLTIPRLDSLTEEQVRGITCIWDGVRLTSSIAVDVGSRKAQRAGQPVSWYPRACRSCVGVAALAQLGIHSVDCPTCQAGEDTPCGTGSALSRLVREYQR